MRTTCTTVGERFQTVIPLPIRMALGLKPGDKVEFHVLNNNVITISKQKSRADKRREWLAAAMESYAQEKEEVWGELENEDFID